MRHNPRDWRIEDLKVLADHYGVNQDQTGSHVTFRHQMKDEFPFIIRPLSEEDGGGYLIEYLDLPGCISDGGPRGGNGEWA
jgi:hypothetical protein